MTRRDRVISIVSAVLTVTVFATAAMAAWMSSGLGGAAALAAGMPSGTTPVAALATGGGIDISWAPSSMADGSAVDAYDVRRFDGTNSVAVTGCQGVNVAECHDGVTASGTYTYFVTPLKGSWTGEEGAASNSVTIAGGVAPAPPTLTQKPSDPSFDSTAVFQFNSPTATSYTCTLDAGTPTACSSPTTYSSLASGSHTFSVTASNAAGSSAATTYTWNVITLVPAAPVISGKPANPTNASTATFTFAAERAVTYECKRENEALYTACTSPKEYTGVTDGTHTFSVRGVNPIGTGPSTDYTWTVDTQPPGAPTIDVKPPAYANSTTADFEFSGGPTALTKTYKCKLDSASFTTCTSPKQYAGLAEGSHTFQVLASNANGDGAPTSYTWVVDTIAPTITFTSRTAPNAAGWNNTNVTVNWSCTDTGSGPVNATVSQTLTGEGSNLSSTGTCTDLAGNTASNTQTGIKIDKSAPTITFTGRTAPNAAGWNNTDVTLTWSCADGGSGPSNATVSQSLTAEGSSLSSTGTCTDVAGNSSTNQQTGIKIDKSAPVTADNSATIGNAWRNTDATVTLTPNAAISGAKATHYTINGDTPTTSSPQGTSAVLSATGEYTVKYFTVDNADNTEAVKTAGTTIRIDKISPTGGDVGGPANGSEVSGNVQVTATAAADTGGSGLQHVRFEYQPAAGGLWTPFGTDASSPYTMTLDTRQLTETTYNVRSVAVDTAGNDRQSPPTLQIKPRPQVTGITLADGNGTMAEDDVISIVFSQKLNPNTVCSAWTSNPQDRSLAGNGQVIVTLTNNGTNDLMSVSTSACTLNFSDVELGANYISTGSKTFSGNGSNASEFNWLDGSRTVQIVLGRINPNATNMLTNVTAGTPKWSPSIVWKNALGTSADSTLFTGSAVRF